MPCRGLAEPYSGLFLCTLPCPGVLLPLQSWFIPELGPASSLGSGSALPSRRSRPQFQLQFQSQSLRSLKDSGGTRPGWDPGPLHQCLRCDPGGPDPPSGPVHQARESPHPLGLNRRLPRQQQRQPHLLSYRLPRGLGDRYSLGPRFRGTSASTLEISIESLIMTSRH